MSALRLRSARPAGPLAELLEQGPRRRRGRRWTAIASNGRPFRRAAAAVADDHLDLVDAELVDRLPRPLGEHAAALDADHPSASRARTPAE